MGLSNLDGRGIIQLLDTRSMVIWAKDREEHADFKLPL